MASLGGAASVDALMYLDTGTRERYERIDNRGAYTAVLPRADIEQDFGDGSTDYDETGEKDQRFGNSSRAPQAADEVAWVPASMAKDSDNVCLSGALRKGQERGFGKAHSGCETDVGAWP
ncbi:hypothetical protein V499_06187 [Pseudogymnoascus sp. VKM F-103]|nr:hypothetical protein V499_06187 [Pseudogymnoascus sp. VKM F-103]